MSFQDQRIYQTPGLEKQNPIPMSRTSILSKTLSLSSQSSHKGGDPSIEERFSSSLDFLYAIYQLQLQRDASFLGKCNWYIYIYNWILVLSSR